MKYIKHINNFLFETTAEDSLAKGFTNEIMNQINSIIVDSQKDIKQIIFNLNDSSPFLIHFFKADTKEDIVNLNTKYKYAKNKMISEFNEGSIKLNNFQITGTQTYNFDNNDNIIIIGMCFINYSSILSKLQYDKFYFRLLEVIRHEIQHMMQLMLDPNIDLPKEELIQYLKNKYDAEFFMDYKYRSHEIDAFISGLYLKAKKMRLCFDDVLLSVITTEYDLKRYIDEAMKKYGVIAVS